VVRSYACIYDIYYSTFTPVLTCVLLIVKREISLIHTIEIPYYLVGSDFAVCLNSIHVRVILQVADSRGRQIRRESVKRLVIYVLYDSVFSRKECGYARGCTDGLSNCVVPGDRHRSITHDHDVRLGGLGYKWGGQAQPREK